MESQDVILKENYVSLLNPKRCGLFGLLDMRGGGLIQPILEKRTVTPPNFILEQPTESHIKAEVFS